MNRTACPAALRGTIILHEHRIVYASSAVANALGRNAAEVVGQRFIEFVVPEERDRMIERHGRRLRGEPVPDEYETVLLLPDGTRRVVECRVSLDGSDTVIQLDDLTAQAARRPRLEAVAALGASIQREQTEDAVFARVREGLSELGVYSALLRAEPEGVRVEWACLPGGLELAFETRLGRPLSGYLGPWTEFSRTAWADGAAFSDDWVLHASGFVPPDHGSAARVFAATWSLTRAVALRLDERAGARFYLVAIGDWLRSGDLPAMRLFGAQIGAALDAARTIADLSRRNADLDALNRIGELAGDAADLDGFFERASEIVRRSAGCDKLAIFVVDEAAAQLVRVFHVGGPPGVADPYARSPLTSPLGEVVRERTARVVETSAGLSPLHADLARSGFATLALVPLVARAKVVGVMIAGFRAGPDVVRARLDLLVAVAAHFASAVESHELLRDLRRRVSELTLLNDVAMASATLDPVLLVDNALRRICETFEADGAAGYLREGEKLSLVASLGISPETRREVAQLDANEGPPGLAMQRLAPVLVGDSPELEGRLAAFHSREAMRPLVAVPLLAKSRALGALVLGRQGRRPFAEGDISLLSAIGVQLGVAVENAGLFADTRRRLSDLEAVHALALRIFGNAPGDVSALLEDGCREVARALECRAAVLLRATEDGRTLRGAAGFGVPVELSAMELRVADDGLASDAILRRAPAWSGDITRDPRSALCGRPGVPPMAMLAVPVTARDATRGVLFLADEPGRTFTDAECALANALAGELAVGLENAELYAEAQRRVQELSLLNEMGRTVAGSLDLEHVLREGAEAVRRLLDASQCFVVLYDPVRAELRLGAGAGATVPLDAALPASASGHGLAARVIRDRAPIVVEDALRSPEVNAELAARFGTKSVLAAPMLLRGEPLGAVIVDECRRVRRFTDAEVERVTAIANQLAVAIENARLYAEAKRRLSELSTVIEVARVVSSSLELDQVLEAGAEHLKQTLQGSGCTILLDDFRGQALRRAAVRGEPIERATIPLDAPSLAREALDARAPAAGRLGPGTAGGGEGVAALLAVPLHVRDQPVGVALVSDADADRVFSPGELSRAMAIASQLAVAVDNARLYSETRRRAEELGLLHEVGRSLVATLELPQVLEAGVRNLARIVDAPDAYLALALRDGSGLEIRAVSGSRPDLVGRRIPLKPAAAMLATLVFERREPIVVEDALSDPRVHALRDETGARAYLGLPLLVRDRTIGCAVIVDTRAARRFSPAEVERAAAIANQLAVAVENARLYEDLRMSYAELAHAQQQLIQQERLAALGELSAVVAHEVRNPLGVLFNSLGSLRRLVRPTGDAKVLLDIMGEEADRLNRIVGDLLDFARPATPQLRPEPIDRVVDEAIAAALAQHGVEVGVARESDPALPPVPMDVRLVRQAIVNIAVNAIQAMGRGGRLLVRSGREDGAAIVEIGDTGPGIPEEIRHRIFEPFFTTKASGTGLGLAVVKRILDGHGGDVVVQGRPGGGALFRLRFPLSHPGPPAPGGDGATG